MTKFTLKRAPFPWFTLIALLVVLPLAIWWWVAVWGECRADGKSVIYCLQLLSK